MGRKQVQQEVEVPAQTRTTKIRPGILVSLKPRCRGGVRYERTDLAKEKPSEDGALVERWETEKVVENQEEHERARKTIGKAGSLIRKVCVATAFGYICPLSRVEELQVAEREAKRLVREHNETAETTYLALYVLKGQIAGTDEEAARSIVSEIGSLVEKMNSGIDRLDVEAIRDAASKAKEMAEMLPEEQSLAAMNAVSAARLITKRAGEDPKLILLDVQRGSLEKARIIFDLEEDAVLEGEAMPAVSAQRFAGIETDEEEVSDAVR